MYRRCLSFVVFFVSLLSCTVNGLYDPTVPNIFYPFGVDQGDMARTGDDLSFSVPNTFNSDSEANFQVSMNGAIQDAAATVFVYGADLYSPPGNLYYRVTNDISLLTRATYDIRRSFSLLIPPSSHQATWLLISTWHNITHYSYRQQTFTFQCVIVGIGSLQFAMFNYGTINGSRFTPTVGISYGDTSVGTTEYVPVVNSSSQSDLVNRTNVNVPGRFVFRMYTTAVHTTTELDETSTGVPTTMATLSSAVCSVSNIDLVFLIDSSVQPSGHEAWSHTTAFILNVLDYFLISPVDVHVSIRWYCTAFSYSFELAGSYNRTEFYEQLEANYQLSAQSNCGFGLATGLSHLTDITFGNDYLRPYASRVAIIVTSILPSISQAVSNEISRARAKRIRLVGVGVNEIGLVDNNALGLLSTNDNIMQSAFVCDYSHLHDGYARQVAQYACVDGSLIARPIH